MRGRFAASPYALYVWWTMPERLTAFWAGEAETDPRPGGDYRLHWPQMPATLRGTYRECRPGRRLSFTWRWDHEPDGPERVVDMEFAPDGDGAVLTITHGPYGDGADEESERAGHAEGWAHFCGALAEALPG